MREAERREQAAIDYAKAVEEKRKQIESRFQKSDSEYLKKLEANVNSGLDSAKRELAAAIESGDAKSQVDINKRIAELSFEHAMTFTAFEIHKDLVEKEGFDPNSDDYYAEVDKRIRVDFPHKFGNTNQQTTSKPVQSVASANRSVKPGRKIVRLTSSQVAIAKKLGVPLEEYAKQLKITEGV
jgi:hypothetical protein